MSLFKDLIGAAAPVLGGIFGGPVGSALGGMLGGAVSGSGQPKSQTATQQQQLDPRAQAIIYGDGGANKGLLAQYQALGQAPQGSGLLAYGQGADNYLSGPGAANEMQGMRDSAWNMAHSSAAAPKANAAQVGQTVWTEGNMVQAPGQNNVDTAGSFNSLINGEAGNNPYLTGAIGKGINQASNAFGAMQRDSTKNLMETIMPSIRSNSVLSGQYGGSRQGIVEGKALESFATEQQRAMSQVGQNNTDAAVAAQAGAYETDRNRQLQATTALSGQQYDVAKMNAATKNASEFRNVDQVLDVQKTNAGLNQQTNMANLGAQQQTNSLNSANQVAGLGAQQGLLGMTVGAAQGQDQYGINKAQQTNGLLSPYLGLGQTSAQTTPLYSNTAGNMLGAATGALGLYNQFKQATPATGTGNPLVGNPTTGGYGTGAAAGGGGKYYDGFGWSN